MKNLSVKTDPMKTQEKKADSIIKIKKMEVHKITEKEFLKLTKGRNKITLHAWEIRNLFEERVRLFIFGKAEKPSKDMNVKHLYTHLFLIKNLTKLNL